MKNCNPNQCRYACLKSRTLVFRRLSTTGYFAAIGGRSIQEAAFLSTPRDSVNERLGVFSEHRNERA
jgi:hypothetical protein